jgi:hypothetical protein
MMLSSHWYKIEYMQQLPQNILSAIDYRPKLTSDGY